VLGLFFPQFLERRLDVRLLHVVEGLVVEREGLLLGEQGQLIRLVSRHVPAYVADVGSLHVEDVVERDLRRLVAEQCEPALGDLVTVLGLVDGHRAEYGAGVVDTAASE
jgi:hypothetical protein